MKTLSILASALTAASLCAQAPTDNLDVRVHLFGDWSRARQFTYTETNNSEVKDQAEGQAGFGIRFMGELPGTTNWYYEFGGRLESTAKLGFDGAVPTGQGNNTTQLNTKHISFKYSYWSLGGAYLWNLGAGFDLGLHLEARGEKLSLTGDEVRDGNVSNSVDASVNYLRPWARLSADYTFQVGHARPFVGMDAAVAMTKTSQEKAESQIGDRTLKSMAPQAAVSVYFGLHF